MTLVLTDFKHRHNFRVIQLCGSFRFGLKASHIGFGGQLSGENHFQGDDPIQPRLAGTENDAHPAACDLFQQFIVPEITDLGASDQACVRFARFRFGGSSSERIPTPLAIVGECGFVSGPR